MPTLLSGRHPPEVRLKSGDVLIVSRDTEEVEPISGDPVRFRFYALVVKQMGRTGVFQVRRLDNNKTTFVFTGRVSRRSTQVSYVPEYEWPDAVHALRARAILTGVLDDTE